MDDMLNIVLEIGVDYGATGGPDNFGCEITEAGSKDIVNQPRSRTRAEWELGQRQIDKKEKDYLIDFWHTVRANAYRFLYKDWNDFEVINSPLILDGTLQTQLTKRYGLGGVNDYHHPIYKPRAEGFILEKLDGVNWVPVDDSEYTLSTITGIVTWTGEPPESPTDSLRWSGQFYRPVRFTTAKFALNFAGYEKRDRTHQAFYNLGPLVARETLYP